MIVSLASNKTLVGVNPAGLIVYSDAIPLRRADAVAGTAMIYNMVGSASGLLIESEVSNNGSDWSPQGLSKDLTGPTAEPVYVDKTEVAAAFIRFKFTMSCANGAATDLGAMTFDFQARLWKE